MACLILNSINQIKKKDKGDYVLALTVSPHRFYHRGVRRSRLAAIKGFLMMGKDTFLLASIKPLCLRCDQNLFLP
jgi:hypothetical protein